MPEISSNSRTIAKNSASLYVRMLLLAFIGLFTSRVVLKSLGVENYGIYNAVGGMVMMFTIVTNSISQAISRYIAFELGRGEEGKLRRIFSTSIIIQMGFCLILLILAETLGIWFTANRLNIPPDRIPAAVAVLQFSTLMLMIQLLNAPFNALIIAHEHMKAFAGISVLEAVLKLTVAFALYLSAGDKLVVYAGLMAGITLIIRCTYGAYCRRHFKESRGSLSFDGKLVKEMSAFAGWNFLGAAGFVLNTQGVNTLANIFFGVIVSSARGVAFQVESVARQFTNCIMTAFNPQITKSYAAQKREYCFELVGKSTKYIFLLMAMLLIPLALEAESLLRLWLGSVPDYAAVFTVLGVAATMADVVGQPLAQLAFATGRIRKYYLLIGPLSAIVFLASWLLFRLGAGPEASYFAFLAIYSLLIAVKMAVLCPQTGLPAIPFLKEGIMKPLAASALAAMPPAAIRILLPDSMARMAAVCAASIVSVGAAAYFIALTKGEKEFVRNKLHRI